jgi:hypothetical protein
VVVVVMVVAMRSVWEMVVATGEEQRAKEGVCARGRGGDETPLSWCIN